MNAICSPETSVDFQQLTRCYITENATLRSYRCENLKSFMIIIVWDGILQVLVSHFVSDFTAILSVLSCDDTWKLYSRFQGEILLHLAITGKGRKKRNRRKGRIELFNSVFVLHVSVLILTLKSEDDFFPRIYYNISLRL
jgi:hypothetical protein